MANKKEEKVSDDQKPVAGKGKKTAARKKAVAKKPTARKKAAAKKNKPTRKKAAKKSAEKPAAQPVDKKPAQETDVTEPKLTDSLLPSPGETSKPYPDDTNQDIDIELHLPEKIGRIEPEPELDDEEIQQELTDIYFDSDEEEEEEIEDMTRLKRAPRNTLKKILTWLIVLTGLTAIIAWAALLIFGRSGPKFTGEQVLLTINQPEEIKSGERQDYVIRYRNASDVPLGTATLELRLPDGFRIESSNPELEGGHTYRIGSLPPWGEGEVTFSGTLLSALDRELDLQAVVTYRPANFSSEFQKVTTQGLTVTSSTFEVSGSGPEQALPGDEIGLVIDYRNGSEQPIDNLALRLTYPPEFIPESSEPETDDERLSNWQLGEVEAFGNGTVNIDGTFASEAHGQLTLLAEIGYIDPRNDGLVVQAQNEIVVEVLQGELVAALVLNGQTEDQAVRLGDRLRYSISYRNTGQSSLGNASISAELEASPETDLLNWNELEDEAEGKLQDGRITWTSRQIPTLSRLEPGEEGVIEFSIPLNEEATNEEGGNNDWSVTARIESEINSVDGDVIKKVTKSQPLTARVMSDTSLAASARFYDDEGVPVGSGLLPPEVGQPTTYRITWNIENSFHDLADLNLVASLPENVNWTGSSRTDAGDLSYDAAKRQLTWRLNWLPKTVRETKISFDLTLIPTADQRDRIPTLIDAVTLTATDRDIDHQLTLSQPPLTTELSDDAYGTGKGRVR